MNVKICKAYQQYKASVIKSMNRVFICLLRMWADDCWFSLVLDELGAVLGDVSVNNRLFNNFQVLIVNHV